MSEVGYFGLEDSAIRNFVFNFPLNKLQKGRIIMDSLKTEIASLKESLIQLEAERRNLIQHFQIQEDNYAATFKAYTEKVECMIKLQENKIEDLLKEKCRLEATILGELENSPVLQYKF